VAVFEKEFHYLSRSGPMLLTFITPIIMLVVFGFGQGRPGGGLLQRMPDLGFPIGSAYTLLLLTNLVYNNFGADGGGIQFFFVSPTRFRQIILGKNLMHAAVLVLEMAVVWIGVALLFRRPSFGMTIATIAGMFFATPLNLSIGNLMSLYSPKRIESGTFGRQRASQLTVLISFGVQLVVVALGVIGFTLARYYGDIWIATGLFVTFAAVSIAIYTMILGRVDALAQQRREVLAGELCKA
jgi:ABC-2 type transport system permease protein